MNRQFKNVQMFEDLQSHHVPCPALFAQLPKRARLPARSKRASRMQRAQDSQGRAPARRRQGSSVANGHHSSSTVSSSGLGTMGNHGKSWEIMGNHGNHRPRNFAEMVDMEFHQLKYGVFMGFDGIKRLKHGFINKCGYLRVLVRPTT